MRRSNAAPFEKGLPANIDAEKFVIGSILLDDARFVEVAGDVREDDFALEKHRRIFQRMTELHARGEKIDRVTVANELMRRNELESIDGLSYLVSLDDGLPHIPNIDSYVRIIREKAMLRRIAMTAQHTLNRALMAEEVPSEIIQGTFSSLMALDNFDEKQDVKISGDVIEGYPGGLNAFLSPNSGRQGLPTGLVKFDELTGGLHNGELTILAARPSMGKTALALQWGVFSAKRGTATIVFELEMPAASLLQRAVCSRARVDSHKWRSGWLSDNERRQMRAAAGDIHAMPLYIDDTARITLPQMYSKIRKVNAKRQAEGLEPIGLVIVDYLQLMELSGLPGRSRNDDVSALSRGLKLMSRELDRPIVALSQLSRAPETRQGDHRPRLSDLRESGAIEQDADQVGFIFRPEVYHRDREDLKGIAELILAKQRNGPIDTVELLFLKGLLRFENRAEDLDAVGPSSRNIQGESDD